jgi:hypothetical protein
MKILILSRYGEAGRPAVLDTGDLVTTSSIHALSRSPNVADEALRGVVIDLIVLKGCTWNDMSVDLANRLNACLPIHGRSVLIKGE